MTPVRGDVGLARFPHAAGGRGKKRPVVVVQADGYNSTLRHVIVAEVTSNLGAAADPANLLIEVATPDGAAMEGTANRAIMLSRSRVRNTWYGVRSGAVT